MHKEGVESAWSFGVGRLPLFNALGQGFAQAWNEQRSWLTLRFFCGTVWALELFWLQSLAFEAPPWIRFPHLVQTIRFYFDLVSTLIPVLLLRRRFLNPLLLVNLFLCLVVATYVTNYHWPLMPVRAFYQWQEAWSLHPAAFKLLPWGAVAVFVAAYLLKWLLLIRSGNHFLSTGTRWRALVVAALAYLLPILGLQTTQLKFQAGPNGGYGRTIYAYGYSLPWICDLISNAQIHQHDHRALAYLDRHYDRLTPAETSLPVTDHYAVLQLESVCPNAIEAAYQGRPVMPFLRELKNRSMYFRIRSFRRNGSCDMDYAAATLIEPYPLIVPYRLRGMPYTNSLPAFMKHHGYTSYFFHGNTAIFYDRGPVVEQLGFDRIFFKEQLLRENPPMSCIGVRDRAVLSRVAAALRAERRAYAFAITLDTHVPFEQLEPEENALEPKPRTALERYLNALNYLDSCLKQFVAELPRGTTLVMYGDHPAPFEQRDFQADVVNNDEFVPVLIFSTETDLAQRQQTRQRPIATEGTLNLLDILSYLQRSIESAAHGSQQTKASGAGAARISSGDR